MFDENVQFTRNPNEEGLYEIAARELTKSPKKGLYAKCLAECEDIMNAHEHPILGNGSNN